MSRFAVNLKSILAILTLWMVAGSVCAQELRYYRVFVPASQPDLWPEQGYRYLPVPQADFRKLQSEANQADTKAPFSSPEVKVTSADYEMTLSADASETSPPVPEAYLLTGHARLQVVTVVKAATKETFLTLGPAAEMNLQNPVWTETKQAIPTGTDARGRLVAKIDRTGSFEFDLTAPGRGGSKIHSTKPEELRFDLTLPRATRSAVVLSLDPVWTVSVTSGLLLERSAEGSPKRIRWTVSPTLDGRLHLLLVKQKDPTASLAIPAVDESRVYEFSPRGLELSSILRLASPGATLPLRWRLYVEKPLKLISARLGNQQVKWSLESEEPDHSIVVLKLPPSRSRKATLRLKAICPIVENGDWRLPRIVPETFFWQSGDITLLVTSPLSIGKLVPLGCIRTKAGELPEHQGRSVELTSFRPDATATISLGWKKELPTLTSATVAELSAVGITATQNLYLAAAEENCFKLRAAVKPGWVIDSVRSIPGSMIADWRVVSSRETPGEKGEKLVIRLASALSKQYGSLRLTLSARRLQSPLDKRLGLQDLTPVTFDEVRRKRCLTAITAIDPYTVTYRNEKFAESVSSDDVSLGQDALFPQIPAGKIFVDSSRSARLEILLEKQKPLYAATIESVVSIAKDRQVEHYRFRCDPEASRIDRLLIHLSGGEEKPADVDHEACTLHFLPKLATPSFLANRSSLATEPSGFFSSDAKTVAPLSHECFTAVKLTPADQASVGMSSGGETWEILLQTPQSEPFELCAVRTCDFDAGLPTTVYPRLAAMPEAVEHHATLQIETTDTASIRIRNRRLEPIAITPTFPLKIQKRRAAFRYETTDALATVGDPAISLTVDSPERTAILAWKCIVQTEYGGDGLVKGAARYELENRGESRLRLRMPEGSTPLTIVDVALDGQYVEWAPEYAPETVPEGTSKDGKTTPARRLVAMAIDLPATKRFVPVTVSYTYRADPLGITQRRALLAPEPDCDIVGIDWRLLLPPGYETPSYVAVNDLPPGDTGTSGSGEKPSGDLSAEVDLSKVLSPRAAFCWRTCLFGPLGRPFSEPPFNPLSSKSWSEVSGHLRESAWAITLDDAAGAGRDDIGPAGVGPAGAGSTAVKIDDHPDWKRYHLHYSSFDDTPPVRIVHCHSLEVFRWTMFLVTLAAAACARSARWIRRLPPVTIAAMLTILLPPLSSALASGFFMGVLVALLAVWLLENRGGRYRSRRTIAPGESGEGSLSATATVTTTARPSRSSQPSRYGTSGSTATRIELGKTIDDDADPSQPSQAKPASSKPQTKSPSPQPQAKSQAKGGSTIIRRTPPLLWLLAASLLLAGATGRTALAEILTSATTEIPTATDREETSDAPTSLEAVDVEPTPHGTRRPDVLRADAPAAFGPVRWPILIPVPEVSRPGSKDPDQKPDPNRSADESVPSVDGMYYLPEPFFRTLEALAGRGANDHDLWLLQNASLRVVLKRTETVASIRPAYLFLTLGASCFSADTEIRLRLKKEEVRLESDQVVLDGHTVPARWSEDGSSLLVPVAGRGPHQLELTLIPLPAAVAERWNAKARRDETGLRVHLPCCPGAKLELTYPSSLSQSPEVNRLLHATRSDTATTGILTSTDCLAVWWPKEMEMQESPSKTPTALDELLLLDVTPNLVTLEAIWSSAAIAPRTGMAADAGRAVTVDRGRNRLRDLTISVDPRLRLLELTDGFTLQPIADDPSKRHLRWNLTTDPPRQVHAKFVLEKSGGLGQFHTPTLRADQSRIARYRLGVRVASNLNYKVHPDGLSGSDISSSGKSSEEKTPAPVSVPAAATSDTPAPAAAAVSPEIFMGIWKEKLLTAVDSSDPSTATGESLQDSLEPPSFVVTDRDADWSFHTEPKSIAATVRHQTLRVSFGETTASVRFDAEWYSGSCDMPEPTLRVPRHFLIRSVVLIDDGTFQNVSWSFAEEGFIHLATGILPAKRRTIRVEGTLEPLDTTRAVPLPMISVVGAEKVPVYVGVYRKPDALVSLDGMPQTVLSEPPSSIAADWTEGQLVHWLKHDSDPRKKQVSRVRIRPNRPTIQARQVVTILPVKPPEVPVASDADAGNADAADPDTRETVSHEMVAAFELAPLHGVIDEVAIFVPHSVIGPFHIEPILKLVSSRETDKGRILIFRPDAPIEKWYRFRLSSPMEAGETRIPGVKLYGATDLKRYVILPEKTVQGGSQRWQTRLLNRENDPAILGDLMPLKKDAKLYRVMGRQWLAIASDTEKAKQPPSVSLADIQVRWQEDGAYLASAIFDLDPTGNDSCRLLVPEGLELLDTRITGIPVSLTKIASGKEKEPAAGASRNPPTPEPRHETTYRIRFTSKMLPQRIEVLYRNSVDRDALEPSWTRFGRTACKTFRTPFLDVEIRQTRWTAQGPQAYAARGKFHLLDEKETSSTASFFDEVQDGASTPALTPYLTEQASLGPPIRKTFDGLQEAWTTAWRSRTPTRPAKQLPGVLLLMVVGVLMLIRPVRLACTVLLRRHRPLFGIGAGLFWWFFLSPSILGWAIIITFVIVAYRTRVTRPEEDSTVIRIG